jgi:hypothetical protein
MMGGKRYLSGWINFDHAAWKAHYGEQWAAVTRRSGNSIRKASSIRNSSSSSENRREALKVGVIVKYDCPSVRSARTNNSNRIKVLSDKKGF